ncbi:MAG: SRPBCC domain-containing protein [Deltaproteobacteria bacterium]|nr:SRPBCC domain-containing protein [Deltaproteobacteria bacterium]
MAGKRTVAAVVTRRFAASADRVFAAWLDPAAAMRWFGPGQGEVVRAEFDAQVGGRFSIVQRRNGADIDHTGVYLEIAAPRRLVFTWGIAPESGEGSRVAIDITPDGYGCVLTLRHELDPEWEDFLDRTRDAWAKMLDAMGEVVGSSV